MPRHAPPTDMTESNTNPPDPANENNPDAIREVEIESILAEAARTIDRLKEQIGTEDPTPGSIAGLFVEDQVPPDDEIEAELDEVEAILHKVKNADTGPPDADDARDDSSLADDTAGFDNIPEFGDEQQFHAPIRDAEDIDHDGPPRPAAPRAPFPTRETLRHTSRLLRLARPFARTVADRLSSALLTVCEFLDRLFTFVNYDVRRILGWVALVLFIAACAITASSLAS